MRIRNGPATVSGDEHHKVPLGNWEGVISRVIRKSGDLSEGHQGVAFPVIKVELFSFRDFSPSFSERRDGRSEMLNPSNIENKSFEIITAIMNNRGTRSKYNDIEWEVVKRVVHTTGDPRIGEAITFSENFYEHFLKAIATSRIVTDVNMVLSGISKVKFPDFSYECYIKDQSIAVKAKETGVSRSYLCMEQALSMGDALFVIGNAPTALRRLLEGPSPSFIIGVPVGFVGASEWKAKLIYSDVPHISISGSHGGSTIAVAITNALLKYTTHEMIEGVKRKGVKKD